MAKRKEVITTLLFKCSNNHQLQFVQINDSPEPPICLSCLERYQSREVLGVINK